MRETLGRVAYVLWIAFWVFLAPVVAIWGLAYYDAYVLGIAFVGVLVGGALLWLLTRPLVALWWLLKGRHSTVPKSPRPKESHPWA